MEIISSGQKVTESLNGKLNFEQDKNRIVGRDGNNLKRLLILADGTNFTMKVAEEGYEATTAPNSKLIFNSEKSFTVALANTVIFPPSLIQPGPPEYATSVIIPHNAGFIPAVNCYGPQIVGGQAISVFPPDFPTDLYTLIPSGGFIYQQNLVYMSVYYGVDENNLYIGMSYINDTATAVTVIGAPITYYVYTARASA